MYFILRPSPIDGDSLLDKVGMPREVFVFVAFFSFSSPLHVCLHMCIFDTEIMLNSKKCEESNGVLATIDMMVEDLEKEIPGMTINEKNDQEEYDKIQFEVAALGGMAGIGVTVLAKSAPPLLSKTTLQEVRREQPRARHD